MSNYVVFQKDDTKAKYWARHLRTHNIVAKGINGSPMKAPLYLIADVLKGKRPCVYFVRYLNDYSGLTRTLLRFGSEICVVLVCSAFRIRIAWILHNVDKESSEHWPLFTRWRRNLFGWASKKIFVTDELLVPYAQKLLPRARLDWLSFGAETEITSNQSSMMEIENRIKKFKHDLEYETDCEVIIGLCVTTISRKCSHLVYGPELVNKFSTGEQVTGLVYIGDFSGAGRDWQEIVDMLFHNRKICVIDMNIMVNEGNLSASIDFIYRALNDHSVAYSIYRAAAIGKPIVTHQCGFLGELVRTCGVGIVAEEVDQAGFFRFLNNWNSNQWDSFTKTRSWSVAGDRIARFVNT